MAADPYLGVGGGLDDVTPVDVLIERLGDEASQRGELLLDSAERRARAIVSETESHAVGLAVALLATWFVFRKK
jgi:regulator of extracellular matrix RemA (YlzA/DUF370 family)